MSKEEELTAYLLPVMRQLLCFFTKFDDNVKVQKTPQLRRVFRVVPLGLEPRTL